MSSTVVFQAIGDFMTNYGFIPFEIIGDIMNWLLILLGFFGLFYWLNIQKKLNDKAANNPNQLK